MKERAEEAAADPRPAVLLQQQEPPVPTSSCPCPEQGLGKRCAAGS